jgi:hypothetical protein
VEHTDTLFGEREREREEGSGDVVRDATFGEGGIRNYISGFEGSQALPAPPGRGNAYDRN